MYTKIMGGFLFPFLRHSFYFVINVEANAAQCWMVNTVITRARNYHVYVHEVLSGGENKKKLLNTKQQ